MSELTAQQYKYWNSQFEGWTSHKHYYRSHLTDDLSSPRVLWLGGFTITLYKGDAGLQIMSLKCCCLDMVGREERKTKEESTKQSDCRNEVTDGGKDPKAASNSPEHRQISENGPRLQAHRLSEEQKKITIKSRKLNEEWLWMDVKVTCEKVLVLSSWSLH